MSDENNKKVEHANKKKHTDDKELIDINKQQDILQKIKIEYDKSYDEKGKIGNEFIKIKRKAHEYTKIIYKKLNELIELMILANCNNELPFVYLENKKYIENGVNKYTISDFDIQYFCKELIEEYVNVKFVEKIKKIKDEKEQIKIKTMIEEINKEFKAYSEEINKELEENSKRYSITYNKWDNMGKLYNEELEKYWIISDEQEIQKTKNK